jgi:isopropylmalate/homocitrate/citramalate synthase
MPFSIRGAVLARHPDLPERVEIIDCTLRDGEQAPGVWFTVSEKIDLAQRLDAAGVEVLDAGFPASCPEEIETLQALRDLGLRARVAATARAVRGDVLAAERARAQEVFLFLPTSDLRLFGLGVTRMEAARRLRAEAEEVVGRGMLLNVVAEDAYRSSPAWLVRLYGSLSPIPIQRFVVCDTVGAAHPAGMERLISLLLGAFGDDVVLATHCHNDFGMAGANSLAAVMAGARSVTCTVNGLGERAGNADLAEVAAALTHILGVKHSIEPELLPALSALVDRLSGMHTSPLKPVTGFNVYSHESGVHVDGMLKDPRSYEHLPSGWTAREPRYVLGKSSGVALVHHLAESHGIALDEGDAREILREMKDRILSRARRAHERVYAEVRAFRERDLTGIPQEEVLAAIFEHAIAPHRKDEAS